MKNHFKIIPVLILLIIGCERKVIEFEQPKILKAKCKFDLAIIDFNEDAKQLTSKILDTTATESYSCTDEKMYDRKTGSVLPTGVKRCGYMTIEKQDSVAHFDELFFHRIYIEIDEKKKIKAVVGYAKFRQEKELQRLMKSFYDKYKTTVDGVEELGSDYYTGQDVNYEWGLYDRFIQVHIENGREIEISTNAKDNFNIEYFYVEFLMVPREEYQRMKFINFNEIFKNKRIMTVVKSYFNFESIDPLSGRNSSQTLDILQSNTSK
jgi:hypothetical protein